MSFREMFRAPPPVDGVRMSPAVFSEGSGPAEIDRYQIIKGRLHMKLVEQFDLAALENTAPELLRQEIAALTERLLQEEPVAVNEIERRHLIRDIAHEMMGFGPLELLMADPTVSDILVN
ncbi:MAG: CpaF family protein, partial [Comamonadaceae bacterium]|nr:CpaF family protein [Comamonadaceae bacterium]